MPLPLAGARIKAADLAAIFPVGVDAWTAYTPTLVQLGAVTKTVSHARYMKVGRWVRVEIALACTGAGTINNEIQVGLPLASITYGAAYTALGAGGIYDQSVNTFYSGTVIWAGTTAARLSINATTAFAGLTGGGFAVALAASDQVTMEFLYEAAA